MVTVGIKVPALRKQTFLMYVISLGFLQNNSNALVCSLILLSPSITGREINIYTYDICNIICIVYII